MTIGTSSLVTIPMRETVPCKWCGEPTPMLGTKECDKHWELRSKVESDPKMTRRMLKELGL